MNYNMMFKKIVPVTFIVTFMILIFLFSIITVKADEKLVIPEGDMLVIYSDGASEDTLQSIQKIVEILTYQNFSVSFASASECTEVLEQFSHIICYQLENYPDEFLLKLQSFEEGKNGKNVNEEESNQILFIGNQCLTEYYDMTGRNDEYEVSENSVGMITYAFSETASKETLAEEDYYAFLKDTSTYHSGTIEVGKTEGYFCASTGNITHIPVTDMQNQLIVAAFTKEIALWKWPYTREPHTYAQYMLINQVYPFQDPDKLLEVVNLMIQQAEPFVISVMPIYVNGNYPAMQHFCEVLRYAQANGGTIIMHAPINQMQTFDKTVMNDYITSAIQIYISHGVYPMALQVPSNWMINEDTIEIMKHFETIFTTNENDELIEEQYDSHTNVIYKDGHQWVSSAIKLDDLGTSYTKVSSTAVYLDLADDICNIKAIIAACQTSFVPLKSLWDIEHSFWTNEDQVTYKNNIITINDKRVENKYEPTVYKDDFKYNRNILKRFSKDLTSENSRLVILVGLISFVFILFIMIARHTNRKKFFEK